jgi:hypothetical protein
VDFAEVYVRSVEDFLKGYKDSRKDGKRRA